ncbi:MAG: hypothetical protein JW828_12580 [Sedimentisphaerales bacterium]|nr:hypothetical protein [Sedimentisphaerales bacterium]
MSQEMLEILIGKFLDGEITPAEKRLLDERIACDESAGRLFEQWQFLHQQMQQTADAQMGLGRSAEEIFKQAWRQSRSSTVQGAARFLSRMRFITGLAAGLILGLGIHFALLNASEKPTGMEGTTTIAEVNPVDNRNPVNGSSSLATMSARPVSRNVDWYNFTDSSGNEWMVEGYRYREKSDLVNCGL